MNHKYSQLSFQRLWAVSHYLPFPILLWREKNSCSSHFFGILCLQFALCLLIIWSFCLPVIIQMSLRKMTVKKEAKIQISIYHKEGKLKLKQLGRTPQIENQRQIRGPRRRLIILNLSPASALSTLDGSALLRRGYQINLKTMYIPPSPWNSALKPLKG